MAVLAIGAIGAGIGSAIGGTFLGMSAAALGWNIGTLVGGYLFAPKMPHQYGPRLGDLKVQASTYGNPIPIVYGSMRIAGNMIWAADIVETAHTTTSGGKGGGGGVTQTSYTYSQSFAVALCEGEIAGIRKIWANGKLIYNLADDADIATIVASNKKATGIRIYTGSETQTADSLIQAHVGAANTPAYRGTAYVVFDNLQLADFGNRTPNLEFEVVRDIIYANVIGTRSDHAVYSNVPGDGVVRGIAFDPLTKSIWVVQSGSSFANAKVQRFDPLTWVNYGPILNTITIGGWWGRGVAWGIVYEPITNSVWTCGMNDSYQYVATSINVFTKVKTEYIFAAGFTLSTGKMHFDATLSSIWIEEVSSGKKVQIDLSETPITVNVSPSQSIHATVSSPSASALNTADGSTWTADGSGLVTRTDGATGATSQYNMNSAVDMLIFEPHTLQIWGGRSNYGNVPSIIAMSYGASSTAPTLSAIVSDICTRAGLTAGQIDVTALTDTVHGYVVQRGTARSQLEQLMQAFYFDAVESDGKIKFVKRGGSSAVSIPEDDLAAHEYGSAPPDTLITNRVQEMELPVEFNVQYMDSGAAYQIGSQYAQRLTTESQNKASLNLAIAMTATKAKQIADVLMYDAWTSRMTFDQAHGWKYSYLEPTDVITVTKGGRSYVMRVVDEDASGGIYRRRAVLEDTTVYTQTATAAVLPTPDETVADVPLTNMLLLDIPLLRDQDDGVGFYAAACGYGAGWTGAQAFKSNDNGATWGSFGNAFLNEATIGTASTALGNFTQNIFDETNSVTVVLLNGELASDTELNVLNGANVALLGNEIIQFKNATLTAASTYLLTGLLRGRQGTEWARSTHTIGDRFVLLGSTTTALFTGTSAEYDAARKYRGVSFGGFLNDASDISFTHTAVAKECYAPVHLGGGRNAALDVTLNWIRRTRIGGGWNNYADVPLGEASESYEVEIWNSGYTTLKRTITGLSSPTTTYTNAQQVTDFGSAQATVYWKVFQLSADRGRGYEAKGTT